jgi:transposase-like protein
MLRYALSLAVLVLSLPASAQITITSDLVDDLIGRSFTQHLFISTEADAAGTLADQEGADQTWDLTTLTFTLEGTSTLSYVALPADVPGAEDPAFAGANLATINENATARDVTFYRLEEDEIADLGFLSFSAEGEEQARTTFIPPLPLLLFPLTFGTSWDYNGEVSSTSPGSTGSLTESHRVDGYGTLVTPDGSFEVLRVFRESQVTTTQGTGTVRRYDWLSSDQQAIASVICPVAPNVGPICSVAYTRLTEEGGGGPPTAAPTDLAPANGATDQPTTLTLSWGAVGDATGYDLQVATDVNFDDPVVDTTVDAAAQDVHGLSEGTTYYWRVRATNASGAGPFSATQQFSTESGVEAPSEAPSGLEPGDGATDQPTTLTLSWGAVGDATAYDLQVATDAGFERLVIDASLESTSYEVQGLEDNTAYYWRVRATNAGGAGPFSAVRQFVTTGATDTAAEHSDGVPVRVRLHANYPNPFNPMTVIRFELPQAMHVVLAVYDVTGREVARPVEGVLSAGLHEALVEAARLPSGIYLYRLITASSRETRRMVLMK